MDKVTMGARFKQARLSKHITQEALAETCECGTTYISDIERGAKFPSMALFIRLVNALDVSSDFILRGELNSGKSYVYDELTKKLENLTPQQRENVSVMIDAYLDELGRIVLPADCREALGLTSRSGVEITLDGDRIILTAEKPICKLCGSNEDIHPDYPICKECIAKVSALK